jgi:hypothetical protein
MLHLPLSSRLRSGARLILKVERLSPSGKWAYAMVYGHVNRHDWIDADVLTKKK